MHDIEPFYKWRYLYKSSEDEKNPFYNRIYDEFNFHHRIYNYYIHPQWDAFGSTTLYAKILFTDYSDGYCILELIGEWNDCLQNDIMHLKRNLIDILIKEGVTKFILICENVLNFHNSDDCYYEEWQDDISDQDGWICLINTLDHVETEMRTISLHYFMEFGSPFNDVNWRILSPEAFFILIESQILKKLV